MKSLHRPDLYAWSTFDEARNVDFHGLCWARPQGSVLVDPLPMTPHDRAHVAGLGPVAVIVVTNSDHTRAAHALAAETGAAIVGPRGEEGVFAADRWVGDGDEVVPGLTALALDGSKTPGELALVLEGATLVTGDLVRAHRAGALMMLPDARLADRAAAVRSVRRLAALPGIDAVLVGDGWQVFRGGGALLAELARALG
jgi:glyoxylase-like metal-dependent hydrolase (beta-lactamase superfamily II)